jgi:hypothetical protein
MSKPEPFFSLAQLGPSFPVNHSIKQKLTAVAAVGVKKPLWTRGSNAYFEVYSVNQTLSELSE